MIDLQAANFLLRLHKRIHLPPCESNYIAFHFTFVSTHYSTNYWVFYLAQSQHMGMFSQITDFVCAIINWLIADILSIYKPYKSHFLVTFSRSTDTL